MLLIRETRLLATTALLLVTCYLSLVTGAGPIVALVYSKLVLALWSPVRYSCPWDSGNGEDTTNNTTFRAFCWHMVIEVYLHLSIT